MSGRDGWRARGAYRPRRRPREVVDWYTGELRSGFWSPSPLWVLAPLLTWGLLLVIYLSAQPILVLNPPVQYFEESQFSGAIKTLASGNE